MNLDSLTHTSGEWLRASGPESDIVISSRIRLARNLAAFPFTNRASAFQKAEIEELLRDRIGKLELSPRLGYVTVTTLSLTAWNFQPLLEKHPQLNHELLLGLSAHAREAEARAEQAR